MPAITEQTRLRILRHSPWDALLVGLLIVHGAVLLLIPSIPVIALGLWWNANTIAHNFIHLPFFKARWMNALFSGLLSVIQGFPQTLWRDRHLAHHAGRRWQLRWSAPLVVEGALVLALWSMLALTHPTVFFAVYAPGWLAGMLLCFLQGHYEHVRGATSHYGAPYNAVFFNDGFHHEHHARPGVHWTRLPELKDAHASASRWPAVLRWLECLNLNALETLVLRSPALQQFVLSRHERAFQRLLPSGVHLQRITIVGGGLFPRTALILRKLVPAAQITVIEKDRAHIELAKQYLDNRIVFTHGRYSAALTPAGALSPDLLVIPLAFSGDRRALYRQPPATCVIVHDWIWKPHGRTARVSIWMLKRMNLVGSATARAPSRHGSNSLPRTQRFAAPADRVA